LTNGNLLGLVFIIYMIAQRKFLSIAIYTVGVGDRAASAGVPHWRRRQNDASRRNMRANVDTSIHAWLR
jgi:hypothetical protein